MPGFAAGSQLIGPHINESLVKKDGWSVLSCPDRGSHSFNSLMPGAGWCALACFLKFRPVGGNVWECSVYNYIPGTHRGNERHK